MAGFMVMVVEQVTDEVGSKWQTQQTSRIFGTARQNETRGTRLKIEAEILRESFQVHEIFQHA
jgi:hypothetical protein